MAVNFNNLHKTDSLLQWSYLKKGNALALESIYKLYANSLYNYGSKFTTDKSLIKECIQELFVNLWVRRDFLGDPADVKNYLFKAFRLSLFKKGKLLQKYVSYEEIEHYPFHVNLNIEDEIILGEQNRALQIKLQTTLDQLPARQKEAIFLKFYEGLPYNEVAAIMGISVKSTYKVMARAIDALREKLGKFDLLMLLLLFSCKKYD